jgi:hypothetical protein
MIDRLHPGLAALAGGVLGVLLGRLWAWRSRRTWRVEVDLLARHQARRDAAARRREDERDVALHALIGRLPERSAAPVPAPASAPVDDAPAPARDLSDEEIDALPPELPVADRVRRGRLPAPKRPALHHL